MHRLIPVLALLTGCDVLDKIDVLDDTGGGGSDEVETFFRNTDDASARDGLAELDVKVKSDVDSILFTAIGENYLTVEGLVDPDGDTVFDNSKWYGKARNVTGATYPYGHDTVFNWPIREKDGKLSKGTWTIYFGSYSFSGSPKDDELAVTIHQKIDDDFDKGELHVRIVYAKNVSDDADVVTATETAVERWREIYAEKGVTLVEEYADSSADPDLSSPDNRTTDIEDVSADTDGRQVTVLIGESIDGETTLYYGVAGSIPGSLDSTTRSAVVVSWIANSGGDGTFSEDDTRLYGETMAHEVGHYLGMFHPVEYTYDMWDAIDDTDECKSESNCISELGENLMFPYPICSFRTCNPQGDVSDDQAGIVQRYTGTY